MAEKETNNLKPRSPVVVVMGHVDHGKTTLLDYVRKTNVAAREAGGITQSIGAYEILHNGKRITFIDTPGHEAFSKMRARGAEVADLAILVVAAEESLKPQTEETIKILESSKTPFIVAINKIDKPSANIEKVKKDLAAAGVLLEGYGGNVSYHGISAKTGEGVNELLDLIVLATDMEGLTFDPEAPTSGYILETKIDRRRGNEAVVILKNGILRSGGFIRTATAQGKIKILEDFQGKGVKELTPSSPALVIGFEALPQIGEMFVTGKVLPEAAKELPKTTAARRASPGAKDGKVFNLVLKANDSGSLEALSQVIRTPGALKESFEIIDESVGDVTDNDIKRAIAGTAAIVGFKNKIEKTAKNMAEVHGVRIITSDIIYELIQAIQEYFTKPEAAANVGELEVLAVFNQTNPEKQVVGGHVTEGVFRNRGTFEIMEGDKMIGSGRILNLQSQKKDANQVSAGSEAGVLISSEHLLKVGCRLVIKK